MSDSALPLIKGVVARLKAVSDVTDIVSTRIYTRVPQKATYPYINIRINSEPFAAKDFSDMRHRVTVQAFSRKKTFVEALQVRAAVQDALDRQEANVTVALHSLVLLQHDGTADVFLEDDGKTWQSVIEFDAVVMET